MNAPRRPSPAIVSQNAVRTLPRPALWGLVLVYVCAGFLGRHPWKSEDMAAYGYMQALAQGHTSWLEPQLLGQALEPAGALLPVWLGAWALLLSPAWADPQLVVRLPFMALMWLGFAATWHATYALARRPQAQPVPFAFGGEAHPVDYARAIADGSVLALVACFGLVQFSHETTASVVQLFGGSAVFLALAAHQRGAGAYAVGALGAAVLALSGAFFWMLSVCATLALGWLAVQRPPPRRWLPVLGLLALSGLAAAAWRGATPGWPLAWPAFDRAYWQSTARVLIWFGWPAWPLVCWALYRWRKHVFTRKPSWHLALPLVFLLVTLAWALCAAGAARDRMLFLSLPMAATLAAFALPTMRRTVSSLIDWFTMLFFTACGLAIWVIWMATQTGFPAKPAANVAKLAPEYVPVFSPWLLALALLATLVWLAVVVWRTGRHRAALWKSLVLPAGGATWCLVLVMTLWLPMLDYGRSYQPQIEKMRAHLPEGLAAPATAQSLARGDCIWPYGLSRAQLAAFKMQAAWPLLALPQQGVAAGEKAQQACRWSMVAAARLSAVQPALQAAGWRLLARVERPTGDEAIVIFVPAGSAALPALEADGGRYGNAFKL